MPTTTSTSFSPCFTTTTRISISFGTTRFRSTAFLKRHITLRSEASMDNISLTQEHNINQLSVEGKDLANDIFDEMKDRFLSFKKLNYMQNFEHFQKLSNGQSPKFMVIACADSRVCPSNILGFQPGDAFMVRNVANLVPPYEKGPSETNAGLEFAVNSLEVENILVIGHSCCGGIRALMSMKDETDASSFIANWVVIGKDARSRAKAATMNLGFDQQCRHCEKESIHNSLINLLTYPWIEERVCKGILSLHGGYYDFVDCTFEKWTLNYKGMEGNKYAIKDRQFWS